MMQFLKDRIKIKYVLATIIGSILFYILGAMVSIPTGIYGIYISMQYGLLGFVSVLYGPAVGALVGFIGHFLIDFSMNFDISEVWWSWVLASSMVGLIIGLFTRKFDIGKGLFEVDKMLRFALASVVAHLIAWQIIAPGLDLLIYREDVSKAFIQGILSSICNIITTIAVGLILCFIYTTAIPGKEES